MSMLPSQLFRKAPLICRAFALSAAELDQRVVDLADEYLPLAKEWLKEAIRIPADYVDLPAEKGGDPECGLSNHEGPRLDYLMKEIVKHNCVQKPEDVFFDDFGNLVWVVEDKEDGIPSAEKKVVFFDGHSDTVRPLRSQWHESLGEGIDPFNGITDVSKLNMENFKGELGWHIPIEEIIEHGVVGRGAADQLAGVISQMAATKIMLELKDEGLLKGVIIRSIATVAEEDNDGGGCMWMMRKMLAGAPAEQVPDCVVMTEGTGSSELGSLGIYRGQRGRMQIEVKVVGRSCHGSMPWAGLNPLEYGAKILVEAREQYDRMETFSEDEFLGAGSRTASWGVIDSPSDCAVPSSFTFRFDRRMTAGESPESCVAAIADLDAVKKARDDGLSVEVYVPIYEGVTHTGYVPDNEQTYLGWLTPEEHPVIEKAVDAYKRCITPHLTHGDDQAGYPRKDPRVARWIFSTDGVGYPLKKTDDHVVIPASKNWVEVGEFHHPAMFGIGAGLEHHCHKLGEYVDARDMKHSVALMARFPSLFAGSE